MKRIAIFLTFLSFSGFAQTVPAPQIGLSGNVGAIGFPILNSGTITFTSDADMTLTISNSNTSAVSAKVTSMGNLTATRAIYYPAGRFRVAFENVTMGGQAISICGPTGSCAMIPNGQTVDTWNDGTNVVQVGASGGGSGTVTHTGALTANKLVIGNGTADTKVDTGCSTDGAGNQTCASYAVNGPGASQTAYTYNSTPVVPGSSTTAVVGVNSSGQGVLSEAGAAAVRICDATNGVCGPVYNASGTLQTNAHTVIGAGSSTGSGVTVTLSGSAAFTSSSSYSCSYSAVASSPPIFYGFTYTSGTSFTLNDDSTETVRYICVGN